jgi:hypothetical protein
VDEGVNAAAAFMGYLANNLDKIPAEDDPYADSPWTVQTDLGRYLTNPKGWVKAAVVAAVGLGANLAEDGIYPVTDVDGDNIQLNGKKEYTLTFPAGDLPPIMKDSSDNPLAYWSLTIYNMEGNIVQGDSAYNAFYDDQVYSLGSMQLDNLLGEDLATTAVTFYLQNDPPTDDARLPYWLPVPDENFQVMMRVYYPDMAKFRVPDDPLGVSSLGSGSGSELYSLPDVVNVPEPAALLLALLGLSLLPRRRRR